MLDSPLDGESDQVVGSFFFTIAKLSMLVRIVLADAVAYKGVPLSISPGPGHVATRSLPQP